MKLGDIIYQYDGQRISNLISFNKIQKECNKDIVEIKLIRNNVSMFLNIPSFQIYGLEDYFFDDKCDLLKK